MFYCTLAYTQTCTTMFKTHRNCHFKEYDSSGTVNAIASLNFGVLRLTKATTPQI